MVATVGYPLKTGSLNGIYEKVFNCRVVVPTYEKNKGITNEDFFLDKRYGQKRWIEQDRRFTDKVNIRNRDYFLSNTEDEIYVSVADGDTLIDVAGPFPRNETSPIRFTECMGPYGEILDEFTILGQPELKTESNIDFPLDSNLAYYDGGYIVIPYEGDKAEVGDYITFTSGILKGGTNEIEWVDDNYIYIIGTNSRGSLPATGTEAFITRREDFGISLGVGAEDGFHVLVLNGNEQAKDILAFAGNVEDVTNFNSSIFILSDEKVFYSRKTFDDNTQFYPLDRFRLEGGYSLINIGKYLLGMSKYGENRLYAPANTIGDTIGYVGYHLNYESDLYSKYSYLFHNSSFMILQKDKQLVQVNVVTVNNTSFELQVQNIMQNNRGLFESLEGEEVIANGDDRFMHWLAIKDGGTVDYEFDQQYQHWLLQVYKKEIYKIHTGNHLYNGGVSQIGTLRDFEEEYEQEINFYLNGEFRMIRPNIIRSIFSLHPEETQAAKDGDDVDRLRLDLDVEIELGHKLTKINIPYDHYLFDNHINTQHLQLQRNQLKRYDGSIVSIQNNIHKLGMFHRFKFHGINRFIYGGTYLITDETKPYINPPLQSN